MKRNARPTMTRALLLVIISAVGVGCTTTAMMIPVAGPLSQRSPVPVITAKADGIMGNSGNLTFTMPDGDPCKGRWASAAGGGEVTLSSTSLLTEYGPIYITGFSTTIGRGQNPGQALVVCESGRVFELEFVTGAGTASGFGIGKDNEDNIYRFVF